MRASDIEWIEGWSANLGRNSEPSKCTLMETAEICFLVRAQPAAHSYLPRSCCFLKRQVMQDSARTVTSTVGQRYLLMHDARLRTSGARSLETARLDTWMVDPLKTELTLRSTLADNAVILCHRNFFQTTHCPASPPGRLYEVIQGRSGSVR